MTLSEATWKDPSAVCIFWFPFHAFQPVQLISYNPVTEIYWLKSLKRRWSSGLAGVLRFAQNDLSMKVPILRALVAIL